MENNSLISRNAKSAKQLVIEQNKTIDYRVNPNTGKAFFTCGDITGYISPNALDALKADKDIDEFKYAEVSRDNGATWVPCLMIVGKSAPAIKSLGASLLR